MEELKNTDKKALVERERLERPPMRLFHINENATETMQDKLTRIMLRELRRKSDEKR